MAGDTSLFKRPRQATTTIYFPLATWSATDPSDNFNATPPVFVAGDVQRSLDGAAFANTTNLPTHVGLGIFSLVLTAAELTANTVLVAVQDAAVKVWKDRLLQIETFEDFNAVLRSGTLAAGSATGGTLDAGASAIDDFYNSSRIVIVGGTGAGQARVIRDYTGATKVFAISKNWVTNPDATSIFVIIGGADAELTSNGLADIWDTLEGAEPAAAALPNNASFRQVFQYFKRWAFNRGTATNSARNIFKDDSVTVLTSQTFSNDGVTQDRGKSA